MWLYIILVYSVFVLFGVLWAIYNLHNQRLKHEQTSKDWKRFLEEDPKIWRYNGNNSWTNRQLNFKH